MGTEGAAVESRLVGLQQQLLGWQLANAPGADRWAPALRAMVPCLSPPYDCLAEELALMRDEGVSPSPRLTATRLLGNPNYDAGIDILKKLAAEAPAVESADECEIRATLAMQELRGLAAAALVISASDLAGLDVPPRRDLVEGLIPDRTVTALGGDGGTGKSLLALQLAVAVSLGRSWLGKTVTKAGPALFLSAEDELDEVHRRLAAIAAAESVDLGHLKALQVWPMAGQDALLAVSSSAFAPLQPTQLFATVEDRIRSLKPAVVVLDTLSDFFAGNENDRTHARQFIGMLRGWALRFDLAVLLLAHPSLSGMTTGSGTSGSTAWSNSVRSRLYFERVKNGGAEDDPDLRVLRSMKANYSRAGAEIRVRWREGVFALPGDQEPISAMIAKDKAERVFLEMLAAYNAEGRAVRPSKGHGYAPATFAEDKRASGVTSQALADAMNRLFDQGRIRTEESGPPSRRVKRLVVA